ncbi:hypothetical protein U1Q18_050569 [Sarracenia purpurea var. burkii]
MFLTIHLVPDVTHHMAPPSPQHAATQPAHPGDAAIDAPVPSEVSLGDLLEVLHMLVIPPSPSTSDVPSDDMRTLLSLDSMAHALARVQGPYTI